MTTLARPIVIVGASTAGSSAAATLREQGFEGAVVLVGAEPHAPYDRTPLSKDFLLHGRSEESLLLRSSTFWTDHDVDLRLGVPAARVQLEEKVVHLDDGKGIPYSKLLIATGSRNRPPDIPGSSLDGVHTLRTLADGNDLRSSITSGQRVVVVGMGFIGCEVAASLRSHGAEVTAVEPQSTPLRHAVGDTLGSTVASLHREHGVELILNDSVDRFEGELSVDTVVTTSGRRLECDLVVLGLGAEPVCDLAIDTPIAVGNGIVVDEYCRTSVDDVYAAGDVANFYHPLFERHVRFEHWHHAIKHGSAAARNMLGAEDVYDEVPWFWSDQYDASIQMAGSTLDCDLSVVRGDVTSKSFSLFYLKENRLRAVLSLNRAKETLPATRLIRANVPVDASKLADEATELRRLARAAIANHST